MKKSREELSARRKKLNRGEKSSRNLQRRFTITIIIFNNDVTQSPTQEIHRRIETSQVERKNKPLNLNGQHQTVYQK